MYRYPVNYVDSCPLNKTAWEAASDRLNCSRDASRLNRYHCVPNQEKSALLEFCYDQFSGRYEKEKCIRLYDSGYLNSKACRTFSYGCPNASYLGDEIYDYPACLQLDTKSKCYLADYVCVNSYRQTTGTTVDQEIGTSYNTNTTVIYDQTTTMSESVVPVAVTISVVMLLIAMILGISCFCKRHKKDTSGTCGEIHQQHFNDTPGRYGVTHEQDTPGRYGDTHEQDSSGTYGDIPEEGINEESNAELNMEENIFLYVFLFLDGSCICQEDLHDEKCSWLVKLNKIRSLFGIPLTAIQYASKVIERRDSDVLQTSLEWYGDVIKIKSKEAKDKIFWNFFDENISKESKINFLLEESPCEVIKDYFRVNGYKEQEGEHVICLSEAFTDKMIDKFKEEVISLGDMDNSIFVQRISDKYSLPD